MNWFQRRFHTCETPDPDTFAPIQGREWTCPDCDAVWVYEARVTKHEIAPNVWDRVTAWWKKD